MDNSPWYQGGLRFTCTQCGDCCTGAPGFVWVSDDDVRRIAEFREISLGEMQIDHVRYVAGRTSLREFANGDCTFFDSATRKCTIYPVRPAQCQTWPFWKSNLESESEWKRVQSVCPGAGCGDLIPSEQIQILLSVTDV
jgi:uncharacterized protein